MRRSIFYFFARLLIVILSITVFPFTSQAQNIEYTLVEPNTIFGSTQTYVVVSAKLDEDPSLIRSSVTLLRVDVSGKLIVKLGVLHDDGINGDRVALDNRFTSRISLIESPGTPIYFQVTAAYKGTLLRKKSSIFSLNVITPRPFESNIDIIVKATTMVPFTLDDGTVVSAAPDQLIITLNEGANAENIQFIIDRIIENGGRIIGQIPEMRMLQIGTDSATDTIELLTIVRELPYVSLSTLNIEIGTELNPNPSDITCDEGMSDRIIALSDCDYWIDQINLRDAWNYTTGNDDLSIGVVDTGIDRANGHFINKNIIEIDAPSGIFLGDDNGHGTLVSSLIGSRGDDGRLGAGVAWKNPLIIQGALSDDALFDRVNGIKLSIINGAKIVNISSGPGSLRQEIPGTNINFLSLRKYFRLAVSPAVLFAKQRNVLLVFSAGNDGNGTDSNHPVALEGVTVKNDNQLLPDGSDPIYLQAWQSNTLIVAATGPDRRATDITREGSVVNIAAPGKDVGGAKANEEVDKLKAESGTSVSAPIVSGVAALVWGKNPTLSAEQVRNILINTADPIAGENIGGGIVNALKAVGGTGIIGGIVKNAVTNTPLPGILLEVFRDDGVFLGSTTSDVNGTYKFTLPQGNIVIKASSSGYLLTTLFAFVQAQQERALDVLIIVPDNGISLGSVNGLISNAVTGSPITNVLLEIRSGINATTGAVIASTTTNSDGRYLFTNISAGTYTATLQKEGYLSATITLAIVGGQNRTQDGTLSPLLGEGEVRIVLTWGSTPSDLDSHLTGPISESSSRFHVYYASRGNLTGTPYAALDRDDVTSFGPETITISRSFSGIYRYSVHDYSNRSSFGSAMSNSGAQVRVYIGNLTNPLVFNITPNTPATVWTVFELNGLTGDITTINSYKFESNPANISSF